MRARPLFDNILIKPISKKKETKSGILMPENKDQSAAIEGEVIAVGQGEVFPVVVKKIGGMEDLATRPVVVRVGEHIIFKQYSGTPIKINGESHLLVNQHDILSIIDYEKGE